MKLPAAFIICLLGFHIVPADTTATPSSCDACIKTTRSGTKTQSTLIYHTLKPECNSTTVSPCLHNNTQYARCYTAEGIQCYEPKAVGPITASLYVYAYKGGSSSDLAGMFSTSQTKNGYITHNVTRGGTNTSVCFDACLAISKGQGPNDAAGVTCGSHSWQRSYLQEKKYLFQKVSGTNVGATTVYNYWYTPPIDSAQVRGPQNINITVKSSSTSCTTDKCNPICLYTHLPESKGVQYRFLGLDFRDMFGSWFPKLPGLQAIVALIGMIAAGCVVLPCVLPIFVRTISNSLSLLAEKKATAQVMALWNQQITNTYEPLPSEDEIGEPTCDDPDEDKMFVMVEEVTNAVDNISMHSTLAYVPDKDCCWD